MKNQEKMISKVIIGGIGFSILLLFSGCDLPWNTKKNSTVAVVEDSVKEVIKKPENSENVLFSLNGVPAITESEFSEHVDKIIQVNPQFKSIIETAPSVRYNIFSGMMNEKLLKAWVEESKTSELESYKKDYDLAISMLKYELARKYFQEEVAQNIVISASEIKEFYDENKTKNPNFVAAKAFKHIAGTCFNTAHDRDAFYESLKGAEKDIAIKAKDAKVAYKDLGKVDEDTEIDGSLKKAILSLKSTDSLVKATDDNKKYWALVVLEQKDTQYHALLKLKDGIEQALKNEKIGIAFTQKLENLKVAYNGIEKKEFFESAAIDSQKDQLAHADSKIEKKETEKKETSVKVA